MLTQVGYAPVFMFIAITLCTVFLFLRSIAKSTMQYPARNAKRFMAFLFFWLLIQAAWGFSGFYREYTASPPHLLLFGVGPALFIIVSIFIFSPWRNNVLSLDLESLTWIHTVRLPVEFGLFFLCAHKVVPEEMTFTGRNFDVLSGISAPIISWYVFKKNAANGKTILIIWNLICLALLLNIVYTAIFSAPFAFQKFGMQQPNIAIFYFPYVWLPTLIVPIVLFSHLVALAKLF